MYLQKNSNDDYHCTSTEVIDQKEKNERNFSVHIYCPQSDILGYFHMESVLKEKFADILLFVI